MDSTGRTIWIADAHRDDGKRFVVHADEKLTAFVELESAIRAFESGALDVSDKFRRSSALLCFVTRFDQRRFFEPPRAFDDFFRVDLM